MLSSIHHPNIVQFYGMGIDDSNERGARYYLVTDLKDTDLRYAHPSSASACVNNGYPLFPCVMLGSCLTHDMTHDSNCSL